MPSYERVLIISDTHFPFAHPDVIEFLAALKAAYNPDKIVHIGDEIDGHSISMHDKSPELMSPSDEFKSAIEKLGPLYELFPQVDVLESNHGALVYRRAKKHGIPRHVLKSYREILEAPKGWEWHKELVLKMSDGKSVYFCHGKTSAQGRLSQTNGMSCVQGHFHEQLYCHWWQSPGGKFFDLKVGCLINNKSLAFEYNKTFLKTPVIGCAVIIDGQPILHPMKMKRGRWTGSL